MNAPFAGAPRACARVLVSKPPIPLAFSALFFVGKRVPLDAASPVNSVSFSSRRHDELKRSIYFKCLINA